MAAALLSNVGAIELVRGSYQDALKIFNTANELDKEAIDSYWGKGQVYLKLNMFAESREMLYFYLNSGENRKSLTHFYIGQSYYEDGKRDEAIKEWRTANASNYFLRLGNDSRYIEDWEAASRNFEIAYEIDQSLKGALAWKLFAQGQASIRKGDTLNAIQYFRKSIMHENNNFDVYLALGSALINVGSLEEAKEALFHAISLRNDTFWPYLYLGQVYYHQGNCIDGINLLSKSAEMNTNFARTHIWLARSYRKCNNYSYAIKEYQIALELEPDNPQAQKELDELLR